MRNAEFTPEPLSDADMQLAIAMRRIYKAHGSLAAFFDALEKKDADENAAKVKAQQEILNSI